MNTSRKTCLLASLCLIFLCTGCATITRGTNEAYVVESKPPGANVRSSSGWTCATPCSLKVKRRGDFVLTIEKAGYETVTASVTSSVDGAGAAGMAGNVVLGGIIGAGVDAGTGAMHSHKPNPLVVNLVPLDGPTTPTAQPTRINTSLDSAPQRVESNRTAAPESLALADFDCKAPELPDAIPPDPDRSQLLTAKRQIDEYQQKNDKYQSCLMEVLDSADDFNVNKAEVTKAYKTTVTIEEAVADEFNAALQDYENR